MELLRITRQIHCKAVEQTATLIHRQYNRDWGTSYSRPPIDPFLTSPLLQNPGGATVPTHHHRHHRRRRRRRRHSATDAAAAAAATGPAYMQHVRTHQAERHVDEAFLQRVQRHVS